MKSCISEKEYNRFLDDSLSKEELTFLEAHVKSCEACSRGYRKWKELKEILLPLAQTDVPRMLKNDVMEQIRKEEIRPAPQLSNLGRMMAAALLLIGFFGDLFQSGPYYILEDAAVYLSDFLYNLTSFLGIEMGTLMSLFRVINPFLIELLWVFAISTLLLIAGFGICISKGRRIHSS